MKITSTAFSHNQSIPRQYTCQGEDILPPLQFTGIPQATKSLALIVDDPDAPMGTWVHWVVFNMSPQTTTISSYDMPEEMVEGVTSAGINQYHGPCPPSGTHRYFFKLFALDSMLDLTEDATKEDVEAAMQGHIVDQAELIGLYKKE